MINNSWIYSQRLGDVFITHDNIGWVVGKDLKNVTIPSQHVEIQKPERSKNLKPP